MAGTSFRLDWPRFSTTDEDCGVVDVTISEIYTVLENELGLNILLFVLEEEDQ